MFFDGVDDYRYRDRLGPRISHGRVYLALLVFLFVVLFLWLRPTAGAEPIVAWHFVYDAPNMKGEQHYVVRGVVHKGFYCAILADVWARGEADAAKQAAGLAKFPGEVICTDGVRRRVVGFHVERAGEWFEGVAQYPRLLPAYDRCRLSGEEKAGLKAAPGWLLDDRP